MRRLAVLLVAAGSLVPPSWVLAQQPAAARNELDSFMQQVLARRDDNWKKLQQYILDETERAELRGPGEALIWGEKREYVWYLREGFFVRSPVRFNGVTIGERDREKYEQTFLRRAKQRENRSNERENGASAAPTAPSDVQSLIRQTREPQFVSSAYFLRFKFENGRYAVVGRETIDNGEVLRIEYYPTQLFSDAPGTRTEARRNQATGRTPKGTIWR